MPQEAKNTARVACVYASGVIGAGFASGQEIMTFFSVYETGGFYGIMLAGALFSVLGGILLDRVYCERIKNYEEYVFPTFGWNLGWVVEAAASLFMLFLFCIMVSGAGGVISGGLGVRPQLAALLMCAMCMGFILADIKGLVILGTFVTPLLIAGMILTGICVVYSGEAEAFTLFEGIERLTRNWFASSVLYVGYNSIPAFIVLCSLLPYLRTRRTAVMGGVLGGALLCAAAAVIHAAISLFMPELLGKDFPLLDILKRRGGIAGDVYAAILWAAMLVSAVTSGFCLIGRAETVLKLDRKLATVVLCLAALPLSTLGFSRLISSIYPVFGYLGLFMVAEMLIRGALRLPRARRKLDRFP